MDIQINKKDFMKTYYAGPNAFINNLGKPKIVKICEVEFILSGAMTSALMDGDGFGMVKAIYDNPENAQKIIQDLIDSGKFQEIKDYLGDKASLGIDGNMVISADWNNEEFPETSGDKE